MTQEQILCPLWTMGRIRFNCQRWVTEAFTLESCGERTARIDPEGRRNAKQCDHQRRLPRPYPHPFSLKMVTVPATIVLRHPHGHRPSARRPQAVVYVLYADAWVYLVGRADLL